MLTIRRAGLALASLGLGACTSKATSPCASGEWGNAPGDPDSAAHVRTSGGDDGDGTPAAPYATIEAALAGSAGRPIFVGPGEFPTAAVVASPDVGLYACGAGETTLVDPDPAEPGALLYVSDAANFTLDGFTFEGGRRPLTLVGATTGELNDVQVVGATRTGILVLGAVDLTLVDVVVTGTVEESYATYDIGFGISVEGAGVADGSTANISMEGGEVRDSSTVGFLASQATVSLDGVTIASTRSVAGDDGARFGRGLQLQTFSTATVVRSSFEDNADAGIFASSSSLDLSESTILRTTAGTLADGAGTTGDGIVVRRGEDESSFDPSFFVVSLRSATLDGNARAGAVLENVTVSALEGSVGTNGYEVDGTSLLVQGDTNATAATDAVAVPDTPLPFDSIVAPDDESAP